MLQMLDVAIGFAAVMLAVSLIVMSLTQAVASVLALRGARLRRGLEDLIKHTMPDLAANAKKIADEMGKHPLVSDAATGIGARWRLASTIRKEELIPVLDAVLRETGIEENGIEAIAVEQRRALEQWFDAFMARVSQWFTMNTRWIALGLSTAIALALHLDSQALLRQISTDAETRARLGAMAGTLLDQTPDATRRVEAAYAEALRALVEANKESFKERATVPSDTANRTEAHDWIHNNVRDGANGDVLAGQFDKEVDERLASALDKSIDRAKNLEASLSAAGISLRPDRDHSYGKHLANGEWAHLGGILATIVFLSLGAPFWFNLLKNMSSLRSAVARASEPEQGAETGAAGGAVRARGVGLPAEGSHLPMLPRKP